MRFTRMLGCFIVIALLGSSQMFVRAEEGAALTSEEAEAQEKAASYAAEIDTNKLKDWPQGPNVYAGAGIVMDMDSGAILFGKNINDRYYPASITKLLTVLVALENAELSDRIKFSEESVSFLESDYAQIGMKAGEELSLEESLYAILLASANEVAYAVAESIGTQRLGGNYDTFIQKMNDRARELGCTNSNWVNPHGLHDDNHYTTARDMALIASAVSKRKEFQTIMGSLEYKIGPTNLTSEERVFQQNHKMLWPENYYYNSACTGGKTGYTDQSKTTLVTMADNGQMRLAAVTLYDYGVDAYEDTKKMLDYGFQNFQKVPVKELEASKDIKEFKEESPFVVLPEKVRFSDLKRQVALGRNGARDGTTQYTYEGQNVGSAEIILSEEGYERLSGKVSAKGSGKVEDRKGNSKDKKVKRDGSIGLKVSIATGIAVLLLLFAFKRYVDCERRKRCRRRRHIGEHFESNVGGNNSIDGRRKSMGGLDSRGGGRRRNTGRSYSRGDGSYRRTGHRG